MNGNDKKETKQTSDIDFLSDPLFQRSIKKTKWKQFSLYTLISVVTMVICIFIIHSGTQYLIHKKIEADNQQYYADMAKGGLLKGAGITNRTTRYHYNLFSVVGETTYFKQIGNRQIVWDIETKKYPVIGKVQITGRGSGLTEINRMDEEANRVVRYNQLNNERIIDFYFPSVSYTFLPQELEIATSLDENKLFEVALSFNEPMTTSDLAKRLGHKNVDWLWVNTRTEKQMEKLENRNETDSIQVLNGQNARGFSVSNENPYSDSSTMISGALISGTPEELERFLNLDIIRASVIGATIDKY